MLLRCRLELLSKLATIESLALRGSDLFKGQGMFLKNEPFPGARRASFRQERLGEARLVLQLVDLGLPLPRDGQRDEDSSGGGVIIEGVPRPLVSKVRTRLNKAWNISRVASL